MQTLNWSSHVGVSHRQASVLVLGPQSNFEPAEKITVSSQGNQKIVGSSLQTVTSSVGVSEIIHYSLYSELCESESAHSFSVVISYSSCFFLLIVPTGGGGKQMSL